MTAIINKITPNSGIVVYAASSTLLVALPITLDKSEMINGSTKTPTLNPINTIDVTNGCFFNGAKLGN